MNEIGIQYNYVLFKAPFGARVRSPLSTLALRGYSAYPTLMTTLALLVPKFLFIISAKTHNTARSGGLVQPYAEIPCPRILVWEAMCFTIYSIGRKSGAHRWLDLEHFE